MGDAVENGEAKEGESAPCGRQGTPPPASHRAERRV